MAGEYVLVAFVDLILLGWFAIFAVAAHGPLSRVWSVLRATAVSAGETPSGTFVFRGETRRHRRTVRGPLSDADCVAYAYAVGGYDLISSANKHGYRYADGVEGEPFFVEGEAETLAVELPDDATLSVPSSRSRTERTRSAERVASAFGDVLDGSTVEDLESHVDGLALDRWLTCSEKALEPGDAVRVYGSGTDLERTTKRGREYVTVPAQGIDLVASRPRYAFLLRHTARGALRLGIGLLAIGAIAVVDYIILVGYPF